MMMNSKEYRSNKTDDIDDKNTFDRDTFMI